MMGKSCCIIAAVTVLLVVLIFAYEKGKLNGILPSKLRKQGFVGAFGRTPEMQNCLAYDSTALKFPYFNRCTWV